MTTFFGFASKLLIANVLLALIAGTSATSGVKLIEKRPAFLKRIVPSRVNHHQTVLQQKSLDEADVLLCNDDSENDQETRFALQYENEEEFLRRSEYSYLMRHHKPTFLDSSAIPASTISTRVRSELMYL